MQQSDPLNQSKPTPTDNVAIIQRAPTQPKTSSQRQQRAPLPTCQYPAQLAPHYPSAIQAQLAPLRSSEYQTQLQPLEGAQMAPPMYPLSHMMQPQALL